MANYFLKNVSLLPDPAVDASVLSGIPDWRKHYILRYRNPIDRKRSLGAWRLLEEALEKYGFSAGQIVIGANGKPLCKGLHFNLSHSGELAMCAVGSAPVGCDIEKAENAPFEIMDHVFSKGERKYITDAQNEEEKTRRFFQLWTMKESYVKMTGEGIGVSLQRVEINPGDFTVTRDLSAVPCELFHVSHGDYEIAICEEGSYAAPMD